jgi:phytoene dehydrogenase-like protein
LLPEREQPESRIHNEPSTSALIFYWGINKQYNELEVHNILFSSNYKNEFDHLSKLKTISNDPTVYIFISSKSVEGDAPEGKENWYVMINVPENTGQKWDELTEKARKDIIQKINRVLNTDIEQHILFEKIADPRTIEQDTGSYKGALYGKSSNNKFAAFLRHPNFKKGIKNIFFTGGSVHPGGGIPLCLASAKIVDKHIQ